MQSEPRIWRAISAVASSDGLAGFLNLWALLENQLDQRYNREEALAVIDRLSDPYQLMAKLLASHV